jgi:hypothetical protein
MPRPVLRQLANKRGFKQQQQQQQQHYVMRCIQVPMVAMLLLLMTGMKYDDRLFNGLMSITVPQQSLFLVFMSMIELKDGQADGHLTQ